MVDFLSEYRKPLIGGFALLVLFALVQHVSQTSSPVHAAALVGYIAAAGYLGVRYGQSKADPSDKDAKTIAELQTALDATQAKLEAEEKVVAAMTEQLSPDGA
jgi:hypothetical protein